MVCTEIFQYYFENGQLTREELVELCKTGDVNERDSNEYTPLHIASKYADTELVKIFLENGADPNAFDRSGKTPLDILSRMDHVSKRPPAGEMYQTVTLLIEAKASPHGKDEEGKTCYHHAARDGNWEFIQALHDKGTRLKGIADGGENGLHIAAYNARRAVEKIETFKKAIEKRKSEQNVSPQTMERLEQDLNSAKEYLEDFFKTVKAFMDGGVDPDEANNNQEKPLTLAKRGDAKKIAALLDGSYVEGDEEAELKASIGGLTLHEATAKNDLEAIRSLIELGADINEINDAQHFKGLTPLSIACGIFNAESIQILLEAGADPNFKDGSGQTCIAYMFSYMPGLQINPSIFKEKKTQKVLKMLTDAGLNINDTVDDAFNTILIRSCFSPNDSPGSSFSLRNTLIEEIIRHGTDLNARNKHGQTALMGLCLQEFRDNETIMLTLLESGAKSDAYDISGSTPLMYAACNANQTDAKQIAELLFDFGDVLPNAVNNDGKTALDYATERDNEVLVKLLLSKM